MQPFKFWLGVLALGLCAIGIQNYCFAIEVGPIYHGLDGFHSSTDFKSNGYQKFNFKSFGYSPFVGVHLNDYVALEGGYIYHEASQRFLLIGQRTSSQVIIGRSYPVVKDSVKLLTAGYSIQGPHAGIRFTSGRYKDIPVRAYCAVAIFPASLKVQFSENEKHIEPNDLGIIPPIKIPKVFARLSVGAIWDITDVVALRGGAMVLRPQSVDLKDHQNVLFRHLKNYTHLGLGLQYTWK